GDQVLDPNDSTPENTEIPQGSTVPLATSTSTSAPEPYVFRPAEFRPAVFIPAELPHAHSDHSLPPPTVPTQLPQAGSQQQDSQGWFSLARVWEELLAWFKTLLSAAVYATIIVTFGFQV